MSNLARCLEDVDGDKDLCGGYGMNEGIFNLMNERGHENVAFFSFPELNARFIIAVHSTVLGPALGGCRMRNYATEREALEDVLRLSEGMTYKSSLAGLDLGGGKSVIIRDPSDDNNREALFRKFGECVNRLAGTYITAEDMGTSVDDMNIVREETPHVTGFAREQGGSGDPSPWTARGVYRGILAAAEKILGKEKGDLSGLRIAVQGVGHVGAHLVKHLTDAGAVCIVCDINRANIDELMKTVRCDVVDVNAIYDVECDIFSPCAVGQTINPNTIPRLRCSVIAGAANNQLSDSSVYTLLEEKGIFYCPDFAINAGGVISVAGERMEGGWQESWVKQKVDAIYDTIGRIIDESRRTGKFPEETALDLAKARVEEAKKRKSG